ncbi:unnamed protein product [Meloidogyne enterolobii]|uniref:Uncharacterized protein n=1 Tax=Meloidogyne enterolobii TaxID=390850 RepID=A0ACB0ZFZ1_MELEN
MLLYYFASAVKSIQFHVDDDIIDKLNYYYTTAIIIGKFIFKKQVYFLKNKL